MSKNILLSIIVPVFDVECYLQKCIESLLTQDLSVDTYEIILVDDGSTDRCGEICDEYGTRCSNVKVIHQQNRGLSAARNAGIAVAQGRYIQFVDSDDYLEPRVLNTLLEMMRTKELDVLRFNYRNVNERYDVIEPNKDPKRYVDYSSEVCDGVSFLNERLGFACYAWQFVIRTALLKSIRFFKEDICFEDVEWTPRVLVAANRVASVDIVVYNYLYRVGSITKCVDESKRLKLLNDRISIIEILSQQMAPYQDSRWFKGMIAQMTLSILSEVSKSGEHVRTSYLKNLKSKSVFPLSSFLATKRAKRKILLANVSPRLLCFLLRKSKI